MTMQQITDRIAELIGLMVKDMATPHDIAELQLLQHLRVKKLMPILSQ